ncbi:hypothetical protein A8C56_05100 [Niabella ginsenosidivorans]|uniref:Acyltransferase 3 domain-containing protein n=1 Tax=Niabella ginsenosidivorans TaxID=1176587 RepID=A0A1A9I152_9BACT|nr:acyltransferase [Niabella ginsenosidivorans]ANH80450.1 hypothetical protein A8C56_05100 [Niabella ginsenosidivorans]
MIDKKATTQYALSILRKHFLSIPEKLRRVTSGGKFINEIDGLRFVAIIPVLIQHMTERFERNTSINFAKPEEGNFLSFLASRGFLGVYIFFVISGFILALPFASHYLKQKKKVPLKNYFWRRLTRLEPPYIIWMSVFFILFLFARHESFSSYFPHYLANITYTHTLIYKEWSPFDPPTWTLEIEVQFYILAPFLSYLFFSVKNKMRRRVINLVAVTVLMLLQQYLQFYARPYNFTILGHLHYFLVGFFLADIFLEDWNSTPIKGNGRFDVIAIIALITLLFGWSWDFVWYSRILVVTALFLFFYSAFKSRYVNRFLCNRWITAIGGMCYTIYLIHLPFSELLIAITKKIHFTQFYAPNLLLQLLIFIPLILIISAFCFLLLEKPFMDKNWPKRFYQKIIQFFSKSEVRTDQ